MANNREQEERERVAQFFAVKAAAGDGYVGVDNCRVAARLLRAPSRPEATCAEDRCTCGSLFVGGFCCGCGRACNCDHCKAARLSVAPGSLAWPLAEHDVSQAGLVTDPVTVAGVGPDARNGPREPAQPAIANPSSTNQCDGCRRGLPLRSPGIHRGDSPWDMIGCTADRYAPPSSAPSDALVAEWNAERLSSRHVPIELLMAGDALASALTQRNTELATLRLVKGLDAVEASALTTWLRGGDIPETIEAARLNLVRRMLEAEADVERLSAEVAEQLARLHAIDVIVRCFTEDFDADPIVGKVKELHDCYRADVAENTALRAVVEAAHPFSECRYRPMGARCERCDGCHLTAVIASVPQS